MSASTPPSALIASRTQASGDNRRKDSNKEVHMARAMRGRTALALIAAALLAGTISSANAAPTLDTTVPVPAVTITDVTVLGPSTVRVTTNVDTRNLDSTLYLRYGDGSVLDQRTPESRSTPA